MRSYAPSRPGTGIDRRATPGSRPATRALGAASSASHILSLERTVGNRRVGELLRDGAGQRGDHFEQEADRVADEVLGAPASTAPRASATGSGGAAENGGAPGRPLDGSTKAFFEARLGSDLGRVRVHTDDNAAESAEAVGAAAYTVGSSVVFAKGRYAPHTGAGQRLLAHELAHVVQQGGRGLSRAPAGLLQRQEVPAKTTSPAPAPAKKPASPTVRTSSPPAPATKPVAPAKKKTDAEVRKELAESLVKVGGTAVAGDTTAVVAELVKLPVAALAALKAKRVKVVVCRNSVTEIRKDLKGDHPRGWPKGKSWDTVPGLYEAGRNRVIIATRGGKVPKTGEGHGSVNLVLHEVGHAVGDVVAKGGVGDPAFRKARKADKAALDAYEGQAGAAGVQETYAESLARFYANDPDDAKDYPHLHAYWAGDPLKSKTK